MDSVSRSCRYQQEGYWQQSLHQLGKTENFPKSGLCLFIIVVALLPGTGNTSTNTLASSQRSNLLSQRSTSLAQPIKAGFISSPLPVPQHSPPFSSRRVFHLVGPPQEVNLIEFSSKLFPCL